MEAQLSSVASLLCVLRLIFDRGSKIIYWVSNKSDIRCGLIKIQGGFDLLVGFDPEHWGSVTQPHSGSVRWVRIHTELHRIHSIGTE